MERAVYSVSTGNITATVHTGGRWEPAAMERRLASVTSVLPRQGPPTWESGFTRNEASFTKSHEFLSHASGTLSHARRCRFKGWGWGGGGVTVLAR